MLVKQYSVYKDSEIVGIFSAKEAELLTGCNRNSIDNYANSGKAYNKKYTFEYVGRQEKEIVIDTAFRIEWDEIRKCAALIQSGEAVIRQIGSEKYTCRKKRK